MTMCAPVLQGYGLTETCAGSFISVPDLHVRVPSHLPIALQTLKGPTCQVTTADSDLRQLLHQRPRPACGRPLTCLLLHTPGRLPGRSCLPSDHCCRPCALTSA